MKPSSRIFLTQAIAGPIAGCLWLAASLQANAAETVGGGTLENHAQGPAPAFALGGSGFVLVKNWDFGTNGTVRTMADMDEHFVYHDQWNTIGNGENYGAVMVASSAATVVPKQPVEGVDAPKVREFFPDSLRTYVVPLRGAKTLVPKEHNAGCGSFMAKWRLPRAGSLLGQDMIFETRVRFLGFPSFWFAIWNSGNEWVQGAEIDVVEGFGWDKGNASNNFDGRYWHANAVPDRNDALKYKDWPTTMASRGVESFDAAQYHVWTLLYRADDTYAIFLDGRPVQEGKLKWTIGAREDGAPIDMSFLFDATWAHTKIDQVNRPLDASALDGKYYEWDYSRVYLRPAASSPVR